MKLTTLKTMFRIERWWLRALVVPSLLTCAIALVMIAVAVKSSSGIAGGCGGG